MDYFYIVPKEERMNKHYEVGFFYVPYAGSDPIHGVLNANALDLGKTTFYKSREEAYVQCMIGCFGPLDFSRMYPDLAKKYGKCVES